jgi:hypothetical protein
MKLYNLFEDIIFEEIGKTKGLITEGVSEDEVIKAMDGQYNVKIMYRGEGESTPQPRTVQVYVYGQLQSGDYGLRVYQVDGYSKMRKKGPIDPLTGEKKLENEPHNWKILRLDRISSWQPTKMKWHKAVSDYNAALDDDMSKGGNVARYEPNGDKKGNLKPGQRVNTFRRIIKQFGAPANKPTATTKPVGTPAKPAIAKPAINQPAITKPVVKTPAPVAKPTSAPAIKPTPSVKPKIKQPVIKPTAKKEPELDNPEIEDPNKLNKKKPNF